LLLLLDQRLFFILYRIKLKMNIDQRDIKKGPLPEILPAFFPNSISYLRELTEYRMYAETWNNNRKPAWQKRKEIGHEGYLETLAMGQMLKRRKVDKVRFDSFITADSVNYTVKADDNSIHTIIGDMQSNVILNNTIKENSPLLEMQNQFPSGYFRPEKYIPERLEINLCNLNLQRDTNENKYFFEIHTHTPETSNTSQMMILFQTFGNDALSMKLPLLYKANRKAIRFLFEDPVYIERIMNPLNTIYRLCVVRPFDETIVIDFAATLEDYEEVSLLGTVIKKTDYASNRKWHEKVISYS
jgi:hypothetical protein